MDFAAAYTAYNRDKRGEWERARYIGWLSASPHIKPTTPQKMTPFEWEDNSSFSRRELEEFKRKIKGKKGW